MSSAEFFDWQTGGGGGDLHRLAGAWRVAGIRWCVIGGLAVNHWAREPIVTRDADLVVAFADLKFSRVELPNAPVANPTDQRNARTQSITDMAFVDGRL